ncbi:MAG TPA: M15 family metallopeptidase [Armatimonadota bacterium]|jgi:hypothetical protein
MTNAEKLHGCKPDLVRKVTAVIEDLKGHGYNLRVVEGMRSEAQAAANWAKGRKQLASGEWVIVNPKAVVTKRRRSRHCDGEAADLVAVDKGGRPIWDDKSPVWKLIGRSAKAHGLDGGYQWGWDLGHVELPEGGKTA